MRPEPLQHEEDPRSRAWTSRNGRATRNLTAIAPTRPPRFVALSAPAQSRRVQAGSLQDRGWSGRHPPALIPVGGS